MTQPKETIYRWRKASGAPDNCEELYWREIESKAKVNVFPHPSENFALATQIDSPHDTYALDWNKLEYLEEIPYDQVLIPSLPIEEIDSPMEFSTGEGCTCGKYEYAKNIPLINACPIHQKNLYKKQVSENPFRKDVLNSPSSTKKMVSAEETIKEIKLGTVYIPAQIITNIDMAVCVADYNEGDIDGETRHWTNKVFVNEHKDMIVFTEWELASFKNKWEMEAASNAWESANKYAYYSEFKIADGMSDQEWADTKGSVPPTKKYYLSQFQSQERVDMREERNLCDCGVPAEPNSNYCKTCDPF